MSTLKLRAAGALVTALSLCTLPALADSGLAPTPECGGDKGDKEVKKPKGDDDKKPTNPAALCGGDKGDKEVKKPKGDDDKKPTNPAALCGGDKGDKEVKKPKGDDDKKPTNPV